MGCSQTSNDIQIAQPIIENTTINKNTDEEPKASFDNPDNLKAEQPVKEPITITNYTDEGFNVSFYYPANWKIDKQDRWKDKPVMGFYTGRDQEYVFFDYQADPEKNGGLEQDERSSSYKLTFAGYPTTKKQMEGATKYFIEIKNRTIMFDSEFPFTPEQEEGMKEILKSISFSDSDTFTVNGNKVTVNSENITFIFPDNFEIVENGIAFGPETMIPEAPPEYTRPEFALNLVPKRSFNEIQNNVTPSSDFILAKVKDMEVVKWEESFFCETNYYEIIGKTKNIQLRNMNCGSEIAKKDYLNKLLESVE